METVRNLRTCLRSKASRRFSLSTSTMIHIYLPHISPQHLKTEETHEIPQLRMERTVYVKNNQPLNNSYLKGVWEPSCIMLAGGASRQTDDVSGYVTMHETAV